MKKLASQEVLDQLKKDTQAILDALKNEILIYPTAGLQQKPSPTSWSALECLEHLNLTARHYIPEIQSKLKQAQGKQKEAVAYFKPGFIGNYMTKSMLPKEGEISNKMKTFGGVQPTLDEDAEVIVKEFIAHQEAMLSLLETASAYNLQRIKVQSLISILYFRLGDAFRFLMAHNLRHMLQAKKALSHIGVAR